MPSKYGRNTPWRNRVEGSTAYIPSLSSFDLDEAVVAALNGAPKKHVIIHHCKACKAALRAGKGKDSLCDPCASKETKAAEQTTLTLQSKEFKHNLAARIKQLEAAFR
jgi:hypothetical protein